jgi:hypothetical protein
MDTARRLTGLSRRRRGRWTRDQIQVTDPEVMRRHDSGTVSDQCRNGALAISYNVAISAFGGTTPLIAQVLVSSTRDLMVPAYMLIVAGLVGLVTLVFTPEVAGRRLPGSPPSVETEQEARELVEGYD